MDEKLKEYFDKLGIFYKIYEHPPVFTVNESKKIKLEFPGMHTKSLFLRDENNNFYLVCMSAEKRLDTKFLKDYLNVKELHFASPKELKEQLGVLPGSVSLFCMINAPDSVRLILDKEVWEADFSGFHPNINTSTLEISNEDLEKFCNSLPHEKQIVEL